MEGIGVQEAKEGAEREAKERAYSLSLERDANGNLIMPEPPENWGQYRKDIFTDLVRKRYVDGVTSDAKTKIADIYSKNLDNPLQAKKLADEYIEAAKKTLPPVARGVIEDEARKSSNQIYNANTRREAILADASVRNFAVKQYNAELNNLAAASKVGDVAGIKKAKQEIENLLGKMKLGPEAITSARKTLEIIERTGGFQKEINKTLSDSSISLSNKLKLLDYAQRALTNPPDPTSEEVIFGMSHKQLWAMSPSDRESLSKELEKTKTAIRKGYVDATGLTKEQMNLYTAISSAPKNNPYKIPSSTTTRSFQKVVEFISKTTGMPETAVLGKLTAENNGGVFVGAFFMKERQDAMTSPEKAEAFYQKYRQILAMESTKSLAPAMLSGTSRSAIFFNAYVSSPATEPSVKFKLAEQTLTNFDATRSISEIKTLISSTKNIKQSDLDEMLGKAIGTKEYGALSINARQDLFNSLKATFAGRETLPIEEIVKQAVANFKNDWVKNPKAIKGFTKKGNGGLPYVDNNGTPDYSYLNSMVPSLEKYLKKDKDGNVVLGSGVKAIDPKKLLFGKTLFVQKESNQTWTVWYKPPDKGSGVTPVLVNNLTEILKIDPTRVVVKENLARRKATLDNQKDIANRSIAQSVPIISPLARSITGFFSTPKIRPTETIPPVYLDSRGAADFAPVGTFGVAVPSPYAFKSYSRTTPIDAAEVSKNKLIPADGKAVPQEPKTKVNKSLLFDKPKFRDRALPLNTPRGD